LDNLRLFFKGLRNRKDVHNFEKKTVSVVVAARNEEKNISHLLTSLTNQSYPQALYEIIIADDESEDKTIEIIEGFIKNNDNIRLLHSENRENVKSPKKNALSTGIAQAKGEIIMTTDADCIVGKYWIESYMSCFEKNVAMVAGLSRTKLRDWTQTSFLNKFENFDFLAMFSAAAGAVSVGKQYSCSGQNLAYTKAAFNEIGGFSLIENMVSGDDIFLMQLFKRNDKEIIFNFSPHNFVYTKPVTNTKSLINQRSRWASDVKWVGSFNPEFLIYLISTFIVTLLPIYVAVVRPYFGIPILIIRILFEYPLLKFSFNLFGEDKSKLKFYPYWFLVQPLYMIVVTVKGLFESFIWKK
jgi:cellulose synthase/poly-beta-1,6-N-acetylglucosamine synthase-like glycosyltransferase